MTILLHICCAPCATATIDYWRADGEQVAGTFFNPNIHPLEEHDRRYASLLDYARRSEIELVGEPRYDVTRWLRQVTGNEEKGRRCRICIRERMLHTARIAAEGRLQGFSTSLLISPWQDHELIREAGESAARSTGVPFLYRDLRGQYRRSREMSRAAGLYMQKYCGCIFSEEEAARERAARKRSREGS
jgi:hypothetical protein